MKYRIDNTAIKIAAAALALTLIPTSHGADADVGQAHQLFIVDHSGSMNGQYEWIANTARTLEAHQNISARFSLAEFSKDTRPVTLDGKMFGNAQQFGRAVNQLKRGGGMEDGYMAINKVITQYSATDLFAPHIVLITDEHRTAVDHRVNIESLSSRLAETQIPVTVVVNVQFLCDDDRMAFGMDSRGLGIVSGPDGAVSECVIGKFVEPNEKAHSVADYIDLALSTGGSVWDMTVPRSGEIGKSAFASAFAQIHAATIERDLRQYDVVPRVSYSPDRPKVGDVVTLDASASRVTDEGDYLSAWQWDFDSDRQSDVNGALVAHSFATPGMHEITLTVATSQSNRSQRYTFKIEVEK